MEQNGGSCAGERSGGGGGGRAAWGEGARGPRGSPGWGLPGPAPSPSGPEPPPGRAPGLSRLRAGGPPPSPPTRSHALGSGSGGAGTRVPACTADRAPPPRSSRRGRPPASPRRPQDAGRRETPCRLCPAGTSPSHPPARSEFTKRDPRSPPSSRRPPPLPPEYTRPPSGLPPTDAPCTPTRLTAQLPGRAPRSSKMGAPGRPARPPAPLCTAREPSAHTSCETRGGGGVSAWRGAVLGAEVAVEGPGPVRELPGTSPWAQAALHRQGTGPQGFRVIACKLRKVFPICALGLVFLGQRLTPIYYQKPSEIS